MKQSTWSFTQLWNESVISENRPYSPRDYCWASEMGQPLIDRFLKMKGVEATNPPNMRSLRKFEAGNMFEWIVRFVLTRAGLIQDCQEEVWVRYPDLLPVKGRLDFRAGGQPDYEKAKSDIASLHLPPSIVQSSLYMVEKLKEKFGNAYLKDIILEIKSCSTFVMDMMEKTERPIGSHVYQCFHYIKGLEMDEGHLVYICKDDMRMCEFPIFNPSHTENLYVGDLMKITKHYREDVCPAPEKAVLWVESEAKFKKNIGIEYSPYLTKIYGFETPRNYSDAVSPLVSRWNRVLSRYATGEKITPKNEEVRKEIVGSGYDFDELVFYRKNTGVTEEEESN